MTSPVRPAAGRHLPWSEVPGLVRRWAEGLGGGAPDRVEDLAGGFSPGATSLLHFHDGTRLFIKAVGAGLNPDSPEFHRREAAVAASLPPSPSWPRLLATYDHDGWVALAFEAAEGRPPVIPWDRAELDAVVRAVEQLHDRLTPCPSGSVEPAAVRLAATLNGWHLLASMPELPQGLDEWSRRNLSRLVDLESGWPEASHGITLLHCDIRSDNVLVGPGGNVTFVDWPHAAVGAPTLDMVCWAPSVALEGGPHPEDLLARHAPSRAMDPEAVTAMVVAVTGFFMQRSLEPAPPGLPTLRGFQASQGEVALQWLKQRTGW